jgi:hypothetical protein
MKKQLKCVVTSKHVHTIKLTREDIVEFLRFKNVDLPSSLSAIKIDVTVPGGGDWSNMALDIDDECPIEVTWTVESTEVEGG